MERNAILHALNIEEIPSYYQEVYRQSLYRWDHIAKPIEGLGKLEELIARIAGITGDIEADVEKKGVLVFCADNGIVAEGVSQSGQEVTAIVSSNIARDNASINRMARHAGAEVFAVNMGIYEETDCPFFKAPRLMKGTNDFLKEPAMTEETALSAMKVGMDCVKELKEKGFKLLALGEMGIGNTTTSAALAAVLLEISAQEVTGRGAGLSLEGLSRKVQVIETAIRKYGLQADQPFRALCTVGGLDICGMVGACLGAAVYRLPVVLDGLITAVAALTAEALLPGVKAYLLPSHLGKEPAMAWIYDRLHMEPVIHGNLKLGEGTGAVMLFPLLDLAKTVYGEYQTFGDISMEPYEKYDIESEMSL